MRRVNRLACLCDPLRVAGLCLAAFVAAAVTACSSGAWDPTLRISDERAHLLTPDPRSEVSTKALGPQGGIAVGADRGLQASSFIDPGTDSFIGRVKPPDVDIPAGEVTLNFDGTNIREVVDVILGELLNVTYVVHPAVEGNVSLQTGRPLARELLLPTLETVLRMNGAALVEQGGRYEVVPLTEAIQGAPIAQLGELDRALPEGYSVQIVPLQYVSALEMSKILKPLVPEGSIVRVDTLRNLLIIAATSPQMGTVFDTIRTFDVDWMAGLSVGFFTLDYAKASDTARMLEDMLRDDEGGSPFDGLFRFVPVESANSLLVVSPEASHLRRIQRWIERLDVAAASSDNAQRLFVYRVKHGNAEALADILTELFSEGGTRSRQSVGGVAPSLRSGTIGSGDSSPGEAAASRPGQAANQPRVETAKTFDLSSPVNIVADVVNNSLLIRSSPRDYKSLLGALKQLDIVPLQVLVEATIVEITLTGSLEYGVQWQIFGKVDSYKQDFSLDGTLDSASAGLTKAFPGFNWLATVSPNQVRATLSALAADNLINVLSSPTIMVRDNQTAKIQVGQEVPIVTTEQQGTSDTDRIVNQIEYKKTGVMLSVQPRVTPGGMVQMEIEQVVSNVSKENTEGGVNSPTFQTRSITSAVAVHSNQAVVLGGLIQDEREGAKQGIPGLYQVPVFGSLFGQTKKSAKRQELVVILTPRVIANDQDMEAVTNEFRSKLQGLNLDNWSSGR